MLLHLSTTVEISAYLTAANAVVIPIGSNEQHGPTGLLGTDWLCPEIIARQAHLSAPDAILVGPTFIAGMAQHHLAFAGTISLRPSTMIATMVDWTKSLASQGFERIYFLNGHGGNVATIEAAFSEIYAEASFARRRAGFALKLRNWWELPGVMDMVREAFPEGHGSHATPSEIAITQWAFPEMIKRADLQPRIAPSGAVREAADFRARHADGRMGSDPTLASPEFGGTLVRLASAALLSDLQAFADEPAVHA